MSLTDLEIKNYKPKAKPYKKTDGDGLYLLVKPNGSKLWQMRYRFAERQKTLSLGQYPYISLTEAREKRFKAKKMLGEGIDPSAKKQEEKRIAAYHANNTFQVIAQSWHNTNQSKWTPDHAERLWRRLELYAFPHIGNRPITDIKTPELIDLLRKLEKRGTLETAGRLAQTLNVVFRYAVHTGLLELNPASDLRGVIKPHKQEHFPTITAKELPDFIKTMDSTEVHLQTKIALKLLMLTFIRPGELRKSKWSYINWEEKLWSIPAETMKMGRPHTVPLSTQALALLHKLQELSGYNEYMFPSQQRRAKPYMSENTINKFVHRMGYKDRFVAHGCRSLASTVLNEHSDFSSDAIEVQLSHLDKNKIRAAYNRALYEDERRTMMQWWGDYLEKAGL